MFAQIAHGERIGRFLADEGVRAVIVPSGNRPSGGISGGTLMVDGNASFGLRAYEKAHQMQVPVVIVANEHYGRLKRLLTRNVPVRVEINVDTVFTGDREEGFNVLAEIPGVDPVRKDQVVMVGAHLDSWAAGTGATDDGAGVLIAMEAMRILRAIGVQPRRTIRIALWTGEEQGALGSLGYVKAHVAAVPRATTDSAMAVPEFLRRGRDRSFSRRSTRGSRRSSPWTRAGGEFEVSVWARSRSRRSSSRGSRRSGISE